MQLPDLEEEPALYGMGKEPTEYGASLAIVLLQDKLARSTEQLCMHSDIILDHTKKH